MRIAICDDDKNAYEKLAEIIKDWSGTRQINANISCFNSAEAFIGDWHDGNYQLNFLDMKMENMSGMELAEHIRNTDPNMLLVFVTTQNQYKLTRYDINALAYMIKPVSSAKLFPILDKAYSILQSRENDFLIVPDSKGQYKLPVDRILYISMMAHYAEIITDTTTYKLRIRANELIDFLPNYFFRCHRSYIVNLMKVDCIYKKVIQLCNGSEIPVSRNNLDAAKTTFVRVISIK